ncbi:MAG: hypothetical protein ABSH52_31870 [Terriglobia bacterium]|jgi:hypothetical protein
MNSQAKSLTLCLLSLFLLSCLAFAGPKKEAQGQVADAGGLLKVHTVCLDTDSLTKPQLGLLKRVVNRATKPKGVFGKLNWQLLDACDGADAIVKLDMQDRDKESWDDAHAPSSSGVGLGVSTVTTLTVAQAKMVITNRASGTTLYQVAGKPRNDGESAFESVFSKLLDDLKALPH